MNTHTGVGGGNGDVNGHYGDGDGPGAGTRVKVNEGSQDGNRDGGGDLLYCRQTQDGSGDENGDGSEDSSGDGNGKENEDRIGERRRSARNRTRVVDAMWETGETWVGGKRETRRKEMIGPVAASPDNLENNKEAGGGAQGTHGLSENCTTRECPPCRV